MDVNRRCSLNVHHLMYSLRRRRLAPSSTPTPGNCQEFSQWHSYEYSSILSGFPGTCASATHQLARRTRSPDAILVPSGQLDPARKPVSAAQSSHPSTPPVLPISYFAAGRRRQPDSLMAFEGSVLRALRGRAWSAILRRWHITSSSGLLSLLRHPSLPWQTRSRLSTLQMYGLAQKHKGGA